ncbi:transcriptional regulator [Plantibacter sp. VKM Ac-2885]|uniref:transcriptional regulator n=1 Tax=Plantibacter sp. VKM Ac-2885 TaxID=2783828 RepID=UPI00351CB65D
MESITNPANDLELANRLEQAARCRLPRLGRYVMCSGALLSLSVLVLAFRAPSGPFVSLMGTLVLTANVTAFPILLGGWRARGVIPASGRLALRRYRRVAPIVAFTTLTLAAVALAVRPDERVWIAIALIALIIGEHVYCLGSQENTANPPQASALILNEEFTSAPRLKTSAFLFGCDEAELAAVASATNTELSALSKAASYLESVGFLCIKEGHVGKRPRTWLSLTGTGRAAYAAHVRTLEHLTDVAKATPSDR